MPTEPFPKKNYDRGVCLASKRQRESKAFDGKIIIPPPHSIYRICGEKVRSQRAFESWIGLSVINVPSVKPIDFYDVASREKACSQAHANALRLFLSTDASHCIVTEDDSILVNREWLSFVDYDYFLPFSEIRDHTPTSEIAVRSGVLPLWGTQSYIASRKFAEAYIPLLERGGIADHVNVEAAIGLSVGSSASNGILHDIDVPSAISEQRRSWLLKLRGQGEALRKETKRVPAQAHKVSFCVVCKELRHYLEKTLAQNLLEIEDRNAEIVLIDYHSQDGVANWILEQFGAALESKRLQFFQLQNDLPFTFAFATNLAHQLAKGQIVINLEADNFIGDLWGAAQGLNSNEFLTCKKGGDRVLGRLGFWRSHFLQLNGYDEKLCDAKVHYVDLKQRALKLALKAREWPCNRTPAKIDNRDIQTTCIKVSEASPPIVRTRKAPSNRNCPMQSKRRAVSSIPSVASFRNNFQDVVEISLNSDLAVSQIRRTQKDARKDSRKRIEATLIYRIWPGYIRSKRAFESWVKYQIINVPAVKTDSTDIYWRERACSESHANVLRLFLKTTAARCIVIEDDAILFDRQWLEFTDFDCFVPFNNHRDGKIGSDLQLVRGVLPKYGNQAAIVSRRFAEAYLPFLDVGEVADHANRKIPGMLIGCYSGNGVLHDVSAPSIISETRRLSFFANPLPTVLVSP